MPEAFTIGGIDHLHLLVGNAMQAAYYYRAALGFALKAYRGPETGTRDHVSYVLEQGAIRLVLSAPLSPDHPMHGHIRTHGDGIRDVAFAVDDPAAAWSSAVEHGAASAYEPAALQDENGVLRMAGIQAFGDTIHSFVCRKDHRGAFRPGFVAEGAEDPVSQPAGLLHVASFAAVVGEGELKRWVAFYEKVLGFASSQLPVESSAHLSKVTTGASGRIDLFLSEPGGKDKLKIEEFLESNRGPGIESVAVTTTDLGETASRLRSHGVRLTGGHPYGEVEDAVARIYTESVVDRPTLRFEIAGLTQGTL